MPTQFFHRADHAVAQSTGDLTLEAAIDLVNAVDALFDVYFYRRVEILISSPGGLVQSDDHLALAVERWRAEGVQICTRVTTSADSAAAVLFSIGDERVVEPTASLLYHGAKLQGGGGGGFVNRNDTVSLFTAISRLDARLLSLLRCAGSGFPPAVAALAVPARRRTGGVRHFLSSACATSSVWWVSGARRYTGSSPSGGFMRRSRSASEPRGGWRTKSRPGCASVALRRGLRRGLAFRCRLPS